MAVTINGTTGITTPDLDSTADISANSVPFGKGPGSVSTNTVAGIGALNGNTSGSSNVVIGYNAGNLNSSGSYSTLVGYAAGNVQTTPLYGNTLIGYFAGGSLTTGYGNSFLGGSGNSASGYYVTTGSKNTIVGGYDGNKNGLDIRTSSNNVVLSDGDGNWRQLTDSTNTTYRYGNTNPYSFNKSLAGVVTAASSGSSKKLCQIGPTCALSIKVMAINANGLEGSGSATWSGNITVAYGGGGSTAGVSSSTLGGGNISGISVSYNNGGSPTYTIDVTLTYTGSAPTIYYVIEGISTYNFAPQ